MNKNVVPTLTSIVSCVGVIATSVLAVRATPKALKHIEQANAKTKKEIIKATWMDYIPAATTGMITILLIVGTHAINKKQQASLVAGYSAIRKAYSDYQKKVTNEIGPEAEADIRAEVAKDNYSGERPKGDEYLFYEENSGEYFTSTMEDVLLAEYHLNRNFQLRGYVDLNEFREFLGLEANDYGMSVGWDQTIGEIDYGYFWIDFEHEYTEIDDGPEQKLGCYIIHTPFPPTEECVR